MAGDSADLFINVKGMGWAKLQGNALKASGALKGITVTAKQTTKTLTSGAKVVSTQYTSALKTGTAATSRFGKGLNSLAMRFVGLQAIITIGMQKFRELHQWIGSSIEKFREFENRIAEVSTILQGTSMNLLPALQAGVEQLSVKFGKSANDITNGLYDILSAAFDADDSVRLLNTSIKASIAGLTDVSTSVDVFTSILNAYGKSAAQAAGVSDILFQTVVRGKLRFEDLASAMGYITPIAANAGVAFKEIAAALATVTRQGLHVDMASRGLALMIQGIVSPANAAATAAQQFGIDLSGLALRVKGLKGFINELNEATKIYGMGIIPQVVRNMRSLRVAMALAGEEGILGFAEDLNLMENATGKTEEALTKMMDTERRKAEILAQSFELVERKIGEAWAGVDIWWKKAQLWWGTLLTGGDADEAVSKVEAQISATKRAYWDLLETQERIGEKGSLMNIMLDNADRVKETLLEFGELGEVKEYLDLSKQLGMWAGIASSLDLGVEKLKNWKDEYDELQNEIVRKGGQMRKTTRDPIEIEQLEKVNALLAENGMALLSAGASYKDLEWKIRDFEASVSDAGDEVKRLTALKDAAQPSADYFEAFFDDLTESISNHKQNLLELQNTIRNLDKEITDTYTTIGGKSFQGKLAWELGVKVDEASLSRFEEFTNMALKYGSEYFNEYTDQTDRFGNSLQEAVTTMHTYTEAQEKMAENQKKLNKLLDENLLLIRKNNLEKMKLQLIGMVRRRGNTRTEMKMMKKLDIENLKLRIENMHEELKNEDELAEEKLKVTETAYDKAKEILDRYMDEEQHNLKLLKDVRDDDIRDLDDTITFKQGMLAKYTGWYGEELDALTLENQVLVDSLKALSLEMPDVYAELYSTTAIDDLIEKQKEYMDLLKLGETASVEGFSDTPWTPPTTTEHKTSALSQLVVRGKTPSQILQDVKTLMQVPKFHDGVDNVPYEGLFHLDKGERVVSAKNNNGGDTINYIDIKLNANIANDYDVEKVAEVMGEAMDRKLTNKRTGKSKYRVR